MIFIEGKGKKETHRNHGNNMYYVCMQQKQETTTK